MSDNEIRLRLNNVLRDIDTGDLNIQKKLNTELRNLVSMRFPGMDLMLPPIQATTVDCYQSNTKYIANRLCKALELS